jgi:hypothetical protein
MRYEYCRKLIAAIIPPSYRHTPNSYHELLCECDYGYRRGGW